MMNKKVVIPVVVVVLAVAVAAGAMLYNGFNKGEKEAGLPETTSVQNGDGSENEPLVYEGVVEITADQSSDYGIETETAFTLRHVTEVPVSDIEDNLKMEPEIAFEVEALGGNDYKIKPLVSLADVNILKLKYAFDGQLYGNAFKVKEAFMVKDEYPADESEWVGVSTGIELSFTRPVKEEMKAFITIEPEVAGDFVVRGNVLVFIPSQKLEYDTTYTIQVVDGYTQEGEALEAANYSFTTEEDYGNRFAFTGEKMISLPINEVQSVPFSGEENSPYDDLIIEAYRLTGDPNNLLKLKSHSSVMKQLSEGNEGVLEKTISATYEVIDWQQSYLILEENLPKGVYYLNATLGLKSDGCFVQVTDKNAYLVADENQLLLWVAEKGNDDLTGEILLDKKIGMTNKNGFAALNYALDQDRLNLISFKAGNETIYLPTYTNVAYDNPSDDYYSYIYTDRSVYKTSDTIYVSGYLKNREGKQPENVRLALLYHGEEIASEEVTLSAIGTYENTFEIKDYNQTYLELELIVGDDFIDGMWLSVYNFEKPTYQITASFNKSFVKQGEQFTYTGSIGYYDGTPLPNGTLDMYYNDYDLTFHDAEGSQLSEGVVNTKTGSYEKAMKLYSKTTGWRPIQASIQTSTRDLQNFYSSVGSHIYLFPHERMIEVENEKMDDQSFEIKASFHTINTTKLTDSVFDVDSYRGQGVGDSVLKVNVKEVYYEKVFIESRYNALYKETQDIYEYKRQEKNVYSSEQFTDIKGEISLVYDQVNPDSYYIVAVEGVDANGTRIVEESYYGQMLYYGYEIPLYEVQKLTGDNDDYNGEPYNEEVQLELLKNGKSITSNEDQLLVIEKHDGINHYKLMETTLYKFMMDESRVPNTSCKFVYFNGQTMVTNYQMEQWLRLDTSTRALTLEVDYDQARYEPGEDVSYVVSVVDDKDKPVKAEVNISVVDEAVFAVEEDYREPLDYIYVNQFNDNIIAEFLLSASSDMDMMAEGGEGGDESYRSDFEDTAFFTTLTTDRLGVASGSFKLPDNITSWRTTFTAYTKDAQAGKLKSKVEAGLDFFTETTIEERYLVEDAIWIKVKSAGDPSYANQKVTTKIELQGEDGKIVPIYDGTIDFGAQQQVALGQLEEGDYKLMVATSIGRHSDNSQYTFSVLDSIARYNVKTSVAVDDALTLVHNNNLVDLKIFNDEAYNYYRSMSILGYKRYSQSYLSRAAAILAEDYRDDYFGTKGIRANSVVDEIGFDEHGLMKPLQNANGDLITSSRGASLGVYNSEGNWYKSEALKYIEEVIGTKPALSEDYLAALWLSDFFDATDLYRLEQSYQHYSDIETDLGKLLLIQGLLDAGELTKGRLLLDKFISENKLLVAEDQLYISEDKATYEQFTYMLLAAFVKLERWSEAAVIVDNSLSQQGYEIEDRSYEAIEPELYLYYSRVEKPETSISMTYLVDGRSQTVDVGFNKPYNVILTPKEVDTFELVSTSGQLRAEIQYVGKPSDLSDIDSQPLTRTYQGSESIAVGDVVTVELTFKRMTNQTYFVIQDPLPKGLTYFGSVAPEEEQYINGKPMGDSTRLSVFFFGSDPWGDVSEEEVTVRYKAIASASGTYTAEPTYIGEGWGNNVWIGEGSIIEIVE